MQHDEMTKASDKGMILQRYLEKLINDTQSSRIEWQEDYGALLLPGPLNPNGFGSHPLFILTKPGDPQTDVYYHSMFRPLLTNLIVEKAYGCNLPNRRTLYLVKIWNTGDDPEDPEEWFETELVITGKEIHDPIPLAHTDHEKSIGTDLLMADLYTAVENATNLQHLTPEAIEIMLEYLGEK